MAYLSYQIIQQQISALTPSGSYEVEVRGVWHTIADQYYTTSRGYMVRDEVPTQFGRADTTIFEHRPYGPGPRQWSPHTFFVIQCKRASYESQASKWQEAEEQLSDYLFALHGHRSAPRPGVYGAVAIGRYIKFYRYNYDRRAVDAWRPGGTNHLHVVTDAVQIQEVFQHIEANH